MEIEGRECNYLLNESRILEDKYWLGSEISIKGFKKWFELTDDWKKKKVFLIFWAVNSSFLIFGWE